MPHTRTKARLVGSLAGAAFAVSLVGGCGTTGGSATVANSDQATALVAPVTVTSVARTTVTAPAQTVTVTAIATPTSSKPTAATSGPPQGLAIGASVTVTSTEGKSSVTLNGVERKTDPGAEYYGAPKLGEYILLDVSYEATEGTASYNPFDWTLRDADGHAYQLSSSSGFEPSLSSGELAAGTKARGLVVIDAPTGPLTAEYTAGYGAPASWLVP